ncbi:rho guanine nucleotide exchange factor 40-like [Protopterus annectens]|uniref:rho guanine nucleotide exchange factor 40-like n=1 Tax=Protopterus annectens TaxID=7888 RepID=UPI001CF984A0|nr:rho guanine nucleotide exchange factor 40-like [Protopterus annectens]
MDREPVEECIQSTLSALYPPFGATATTLLCQAFEVVEKVYHEDALRYVIEFLIPAKHILQKIQQDACAQYSGFLFRHEGWPLCLHEKVVVQLSTLSWQALQPGDFYLQMTPYLARSPRLMLKCLSRDGYSVQEIVVGEDCYPFIFTVEWLNSINKDRNAVRLENCLLVADNNVLRVSWQEVVYPQFVHKEGLVVGSRHSQNTVWDIGLPRNMGLSSVFTLQHSEVLEDVLSHPSVSHKQREGFEISSTTHLRDADYVSTEYGKEFQRSNDGCTHLNKDAEHVESSKENIEGEYVELLEIVVQKHLPSQEEMNTNSKQKYLEMNGIFKTKTIPLRKGHNKNRNRNHKAWLHQKPSKVETQHVAGKWGTNEALHPSTSFRQKACGSANVETRVSNIVIDNRTVSLPEAAEKDTCDEEVSTFTVTTGMTEGNNSCANLCFASNEKDSLESNQNTAITKMVHEDSRGNSLQDENEEGQRRICIEFQPPKADMVCTNNCGGEDMCVYLVREAVIASQVSGTGEHCGDNCTETETSESDQENIKTNLLPLSPQAQEPIATKDEVNELPVGSLEIPAASDTDSLTRKNQRETDNSQSSVISSSSSTSSSSGFKSLSTETSLDGTLVAGQLSAETPITTALFNSSMYVSHDSLTPQSVVDSALEDSMVLFEDSDCCIMDVMEDLGQLQSDFTTAIHATDTSHETAVIENGISQPLEHSVDSQLPVNSLHETENNSEALITLSEPKPQIVNDSVFGTDVPSLDLCATTQDQTLQPKEVSTHLLDKCITQECSNALSLAHSEKEINNQQEFCIKNPESAEVSQGDQSQCSEDSQTAIVQTQLSLASQTENSTDSSICIQELLKDSKPLSKKNGNNKRRKKGFQKTKANSKSESQEQENIVSDDSFTMDCSQNAPMIEELTMECNGETVTPVDTLSDNLQNAVMESSLAKDCSCDATIEGCTEAEKEEVKDIKSNNHEGLHQQNESQDILLHTSDHAQENTEPVPGADAPEKKNEEEETPITAEEAPTIAETTVTFPTRLKEIDLEIACLGILCLTGSRDRSGRVIVMATLQSDEWQKDGHTCEKLTKVLHYLYSIPRQEVRDLGLTVLVDARHCTLPASFFEVLTAFQKTVPRGIHSILVFVQKESTACVKQLPGVQTEIITSIHELQKFVDIADIPQSLGGSYEYSHLEWLEFRKKIEPFSDACQEVLSFLQSITNRLETQTYPGVTEEASSVIAQHQVLMKDVLTDQRLAEIQRNGGRVLALLHKQPPSVSKSKDYRDAITLTSVLYDQVDNAVHCLVRLSNQHMRRLEVQLELKDLEQRLQNVSSWLDGGAHLQTFGNTETDEHSLEALRKRQKEFLEFHQLALERCRERREELKQMECWEATPSSPKDTCLDGFHQCQAQLEEFTQRLDQCQLALDKTVQLYEFLNKACDWTLEGMHKLSCIGLEDCCSPAQCDLVIRSLEHYQQMHLQIPDSQFQRMKELAQELKSPRALSRCNFAWTKCQETKKAFEKKMESVIRTKKLLASEIALADQLEGHRKRSDSISSAHGKAEGWKLWNWAPKLSPSRSMISLNVKTTGCTQGMTNSPSMQSIAHAEDVAGDSHGENIHRPDSTPQVKLTRNSSLSQMPTVRVSDLPRKIQRGCKNMGLNLAGSASEGSASPFLPIRSQVPVKLLRKAQSFDASTQPDHYWTHGSADEPGLKHSISGVRIKGLEVSSTEVVDRTCSPKEHVMLGRAGGIMADAPWSTPRMERKNRASNLQLLAAELVKREKEYVHSLSYVTKNYFGEMDHQDAPQALRGKRSVVFGNIEKLYAFHSHYFFKELEMCISRPFATGLCFLRYTNQFSLYSLYIKNKPKSDALLRSHGATFFKRRQEDLQDTIGLSTRLLQPIQHLNAYCKLLEEMIKEGDLEQQLELQHMQAAVNMLRQQLQRGYDLQALDCVSNCNIDLKEQGQLIHHDDFTVWYGRKKIVRHIFLLEQLILFTKLKQTDGKTDAYTYKHSFKTADIGLTENIGDSGLRFEIWFRRRKSKESYILQASSIEVKQAWADTLAQILWQQAARNKELRIQEMVSMGIGNKPFMDIRASDSPVNNRMIDCFISGRGSRSRASVAVSSFDHASPFRRSVSCGNSPFPFLGPSLGPLNLHAFSNPPFIQGIPLRDRIDEEIEYERGSQPSLNSSGSSSGGSTGQHERADDVNSTVSGFLPSRVGPLLGIPQSSRKASSPTSLRSPWGESSIDCIKLSGNSGTHPSTVV